MKNNSVFRRRLGGWLILIGLLIFVFVIVFDLSVRPVFELTCAFQCRAIAEKAINRAVFDMLEDENISYASIISIRYGSSGQISSIESNIVAMNTLKALSSQKINDAIGKIDGEDVGVSVGTASGIEFLYGQGPIMTLGLVPLGHASTYFDSRFTSQGINQTLHSIYLHVDVDISAVAPWFTTTVNVSTDIIIAETVIVGNIPESYTNIIL